jgi:hypothetical protein
MAANQWPERNRSSRFVGPRSMINLGVGIACVVKNLGIHRSRLTNGGRLSVDINPTITISFIRPGATTAVMITSASPPFLSLLRINKELGSIANSLKPVADVAEPGSNELRATAESPEGVKQRSKGESRRNIRTES